MKPEFVGIERRLERLNECLQKSEPPRDKTQEVFDNLNRLDDVVCFAEAIREWMKQRPT